MPMRLLGVKAFGRDGTEDDYVVFNTSEIDYIELSKPSKNAEKIPLYHTHRGAFFALLTLEGISHLLQSEGITHLDSVNLVNINNVEYIVETSYYVRAYFRNGTYASVSKPNLCKVAHIPRRPPE